MSLYDHKISIQNSDRQEISGPVTFIRLDASTGALKIDIDGKISGLVQGKAIKSEAIINRFSIINESGAAVDATLSLGHNAEIQDSNLSGTVGVSKPTTIDTVADVALVAATATQILPADPSRREALISNLEGAVNAIRVGDANVGAARGSQVGAGMTITLQGTEAIWGYSVAGLSVAVTTIRD